MTHQQNEQVFRGIAVSGGIAHARVFLLGRTDRGIERRTIDPSEVISEFLRLTAGLAETRQAIKAIHDQVAAAMGQSEAGIFEAHLLVLEDANLLSEVQKVIREQNVDAVYAYHWVSEKFATALGAVDDDYLRERAADLRDIAGRVIDNMMGVPGESALALLKEPCLVIAHDLSPSTTAQLDPKKVLGFATDQGGRTSHTAIMARKLGIPAVVGLGNITQKVRTGDYALLDGHSGTLVVAPTDQTLFAYGQLQQRHVALNAKLHELRDQPAVTLDGHGLILAANIERTADLPPVRTAGAAGVGLFRTEFLFLNRASVPSEDEQYAAYRAVAEGCGSDPVIIRTLDLGGDKLPANFASAGEPNPFLGWRAIRISLDRPELFRAQLRAILRASAHGPVKLLYPMISGLAELRAANALLERCREELRQEGQGFDPAMEVGVMIEIPSAVMVADQLARECQFFSIGTNDLTGYTLAVDRLNERVAHLYTPTHPAVIKLISLTVAAARRQGRWVGVCGEMAGEPQLVPLLVGLGVDELSATPRVIPEVKFLLRRLKLSEAKALANEALACDCPQKILEQSQKLAHAVAPDLFGKTAVG